MHDVTSKSAHDNLLLALADHFRLHAADIEAAVALMRTGRADLLAGVIDDKLTVSAALTMAKGRKEASS
jgi:hypothetical protein